jgi:hypothetical protein
MSAVLRFLLSLLLGSAVAVPGVLLLNALGLDDGLAYLGLVLVAMIVGSLADRERYYGPRPDASR